MADLRQRVSDVLVQFSLLLSVQEQDVLGLNERSIVRLEYWEYRETTKSKVISQANSNTSWESDELIRSLGKCMQRAPNVAEYL